MWSFTWRNPINSHRVYTCKPFDGFRGSDAKEELIISTEYMRAFGVVKSVSITSATTTTIIESRPGGSILIGDIVVSAKKVAGTTLDIEFDDMTNTEIIMSPDTVNQSANIAWTPAGRVQGWRDADLKAVSVGSNTVATITATYVHLKKGLTFSDWDSVR